MTVFKRLKPFLTVSNGLALGILIISIVAYFWLRTGLGVNVFSQEGFDRFIKDLGWFAPLIYIVVIAIAVVISQIPGVPLAIAAGAVWGPIVAGVYSVIGGFIGGMIAYFLGRTLGRSAMKALTGKVVYFSKERGEPYLGWLIFITRLLPILSFDLISYAAGLTRLSVPIYAAATLLGMIPSTFLLTYLGSAFNISLPWALGLSALALVFLVAIPLLLRKRDVFGLKGVMHFE